MSWSAPGTVAQPAPTLAFSTRPITAHNPGRLVKLPDPAPLDVTERYGEAAAVSFTDGLNGQTTYFYHVQLTGLRAGNAVLLPGQRRRGDAVHRGRVVRDRAARPGEVPLLQLRRPGHPVLGPQRVGQHLARVLRQLLVRGHRDREPGRRQGRAAVPPAQRRPVLRQPGRRQRARRVAGLRQQRRPQRGQPAVDARARQPRERVRHRQLAPATPGSAPGGIAAQGAAGNYWNGPYGYGHYLSRFLLPDNGLINWDGNRLRGNFYAFQVGTVKFISLDADDVIYQDGARQLRHQLGERRAGDHHDRRGDPERHHHLQPLLHRRPEARREEQLARARLLERQAQPADALAGGDPRRGPPRPVGGHDRGVHAPVRDVDLGAGQRLRPRHPPGLAAAVRQVRGRPGAVRATSTTTSGATRSAATTPGSSAPSSRPTRARPRARRSTPGARRWSPPSRTSSTASRRWNTGEGTVYLVLGGGGTNGPTNTYGTDAADDKPQAKVITDAERGHRQRRRPGSSRTAPTRSRTRPGPRRSTRPTPTATRSSTSTRASGRGETTITFQYFAIPAVSNEAGTAHDGTTTLPSVPTEKFVFGRKVGKRQLAPGTAALAHAQRTPDSSGAADTLAQLRPARWSAGPER